VGWPWLWLACGWHAWVLQVVGMDPNTAMEAYSVEKAAAVGLQDYTFVLGDAQQMPFEAASFDAAVVTLVR
jgi:ubiquinone/menaquinone biosynthesis C-methylase UbiE